MAECGTEGDTMQSHATQADTHRRLSSWEDSCFHSKEHIRLSRELGDKREECKGLFSLGAVFHTRGKRACSGCKGVDPGRYPPGVTGPLRDSLPPYEAALSLSRETGEREMEGRLLGNLGTVCYMLGRFNEAILYHRGRLEVALSGGDKVAQKRAHSNLGNAFVFVGELESAIGHYKQGLCVARETGHLSSEGHLCYSLGSSYTLLRDYPTATQFQQRHLEIATSLKDKAGCLRANWALSNSCSCQKRQREALRFSKRHLSLATEIGDTAGVEIARHNVSCLERHTGRHKDSGGDPETQEMLPSEGCLGPLSSDLSNGDPFPADYKEVLVEQQGDELSPEETQDVLDHFLVERLFLSQGNRLDEQRCPYATLSPPLPHRTRVLPLSRSVDNLLLLVAESQRDRIEEQRAPLRTRERAKHLSVDILMEESRNLANFIDRCQSHSLDEQRSAATFLPLAGRPKRHFNEYEQTEDFFNLILQAQSHRLDDQRTVPALPLK